MNAFLMSTGLLQVKFEPANWHYAKASSAPLSNWLQGTIIFSVPSLPFIS